MIEPFTQALRRAFGPDTTVMEPMRGPEHVWEWLCIHRPKHIYFSAWIDDTKLLDLDGWAREAVVVANQKFDAQQRPDE